MRNVVIDNPTGPMRPGPSPHFAAIRGRVLLAIFVAAVAAGVALVGVAYVLLWPEELEIEAAPLPDALTMLAIYALLALFLWIACLRAGVVNQFSLGSRPDPRETWVYILLGVPLFAVSLCGVYILYLPLSYFFPAFVTVWLLESPPLIWWRADPEFLLASFINALVIVVIAPVIEETFFRGFLLNRWWRKYGVPRAVIFSSVAFAVVHIQIGMFVFAVLLSLIYVKTRSLIGPIIVHAANNGIAILPFLLEGVVTGDVKMVYTLEEFRAYWWLALVGAAVGVPWLVWFVKRLFRREAVAA